MFEIAALAVVTVLFFITARERKQNPWLWSLVAVVSFYGSIIVYNFVIKLILGSLMEKEGLQFLFLIAEILVGVVSAMVVKKSILEQR